MGVGKKKQSFFIKGLAFHLFPAIRFRSNLARDDDEAAEKKRTRKSTSALSELQRRKFEKRNKARVANLLDGVRILHLYIQIIEIQLVEQGLLSQMIFLHLLRNRLLCVGPEELHQLAVLDDALLHVHEEAHCAVRGVDVLGPDTGPGFDARRSFELRLLGRDQFKLRLGLPVAVARQILGLSFPVELDGDGDKVLNGRDLAHARFAAVLRVEIQ